MKFSFFFFDAKPIRRIGTSDAEATQFFSYFDFIVIPLLPPANEVC